MARVLISDFAKQIRIGTDKLLVQLEEAGVVGKRADGELDDAEKQKLLEFLRGRAERSGVTRQQVNVNRRTTSEIRQTSRTGAARTVQVEVKKRRNFVEGGGGEGPITPTPVAKAVTESAGAVPPTPAAQPAVVAVKGEEGIEEVVGEEGIEEEVAEEVGIEEEAAEEVAEEVVEEVVEEKGKGAEEEGSEGEEFMGGGEGEVQEGERWKRRRGKRGGRRRREREGLPGKREELHVEQGAARKARRLRKRKPAKITSKMAEKHSFAKPTAPVVREVAVPETIGVLDLAAAMSVKVGEVLKMLIKLGVTANINQVLDQDTAILVVEELGHTAKAVQTEDLEAEVLAGLEAAGEDAGADVRTRPPVVTVMGHVDHGKTSLLDYIRKSNVTGGEAGGITQHIGAYRVALPGKNGGEICFLDTPGHEAFSAMRARGAGATDLVILVVAGDDGVKPQTVEAISHAKAAGAPIVVAINKMDKEEADANKVIEELSQHEVVTEKWGGDVLVNEVSAANGEGVEGLLESVLVQAEVLDLKARYTGAARGQVVEARLDKGRGAAATVLVQQGRLNAGDVVLAGRAFGRVRALFDDQGRAVKFADPSTPVEVYGLDGVPVAGDDFMVVGDERQGREIAEVRQRRYREGKIAQQLQGKGRDYTRDLLRDAVRGEQQALNLVIKCDVQGSVEALTEAMERLSNEEVRIKVVHGMVGGINESDVNLAAAAGAMIIGFNVRADAAARGLMEKEGIEVIYHKVIYEAVEVVEARILGMLKPVETERQVGLVEVRDVFRTPKVGAIAGCYVLEGAVRRNLPVRVLRDNIVIFEGALDSLRRFKDDVQEVKSGFECGIGIKDYNDVKVGDQIEVFEVVEVAREL